MTRNRPAGIRIELRRSELPITTSPPVNTTRRQRSRVLVEVRSLPVVTVRNFNTASTLAPVIAWAVPTRVLSENMKKIEVFDEVIEEIGEGDTK